MRQQNILIWTYFVLRKFTNFSTQQYVIYIEDIMISNYNTSWQWPADNTTTRRRHADDEWSSFFLKLIRKAICALWLEKKNIQTTQILLSAAHLLKNYIVQFIFKVSYTARKDTKVSHNLIIHWNLFHLFSTQYYLNWIKIFLLKYYRCQHIVYNYITNVFNTEIKKCHIIYDDEAKHMLQ